MSVELAWRAPRSVSGQIAIAILEAVHDAFPKARQRRQLAAALARAAGRAEARARTQVQHQAAAGLREALEARTAPLDRSPVGRLTRALVMPLCAPSCGAEAVLLASPPDDARARLLCTLAALDRLREQVLTMAQTITDQLDRIDGDPDFEPDADTEPNLGGPIGRPGWDDAEWDHADHEPSLGSQEGGHGGTRWNRVAYRFGWGDGDEHECEDEGAQCDDEGEDSDTEQEEAEVCAWRSGEVDQTAPGFLPAYNFGADNTYAEDGEPA